MSRLDDIRALQRRLREIDSSNAVAVFTELFQRGYDLLRFDDESAAQIFDTSIPNMGRWKRGEVVPPAAAMVLKMLKEEAEAAIVCLSGETLWD